MMALGVGDLKEFLAEAQAADASFAHVYANKEKAQLAYYELAAARWNFTTQLSGLRGTEEGEGEAAAGDGHRPRGAGARRSREARQEEDQAGGLQGAS